MKRFFGFLLVAGVGTHLNVHAAQAEVSASCNNDNSGERRAIKCNVSPSQLGISSRGNSATARKLYIKKPAGDTGKEIVRVWIDGRLVSQTIIAPGTQLTLFKKKHNSTIVARYEIETVKLPTNGPSQFYVHFEALTPVTIDQTNCSNIIDNKRASVCWSRGQ